ncbi:MAG: SDR family NAD(P)-dependent oxidoreductase [Deltaproteobacteria bacterium]|nr:SDR family NAD(P)-dependent oxidoreductase [Deltaproteobacteria bacterium]
MKIVLLGATRGMGRSLARLCARRGDAVALLGRERDEIARSARDLVALGAGAVAQGICDLDDPARFGPALAAAADALGGLDAVVLSAADFARPADLDADPARAVRLATRNFAHSIAFLEAARVRLLAHGGGTLCVFSSVAGDRARKATGIYGATKAGLSHYAVSLDLRDRPRGLRVVLVKPGFVRTGMTADLPVPPFAGEPDAVARRVLRAIDRGWPVVYAPPIWRLVMLVIRTLPRFVMRRAEF